MVVAFSAMEYNGITVVLCSTYVCIYNIPLKYINNLL